MKKLNINYIFIGISLLWLLSGCTTFNSTLDTNKTIKTKNIKSGKVCSRYLFGAIKFPYVGHVGIKLSGSESATKAMMKGNITKPFGIDKRVKNYFFYSNKCLTVFGE